MPNELRRLLNSHEFFRQAVRDYRTAMSREHVEGLRRERDRIFDELVSFTSSHAHVTLTQLKFLLASLSEQASDPKQAERLRKICVKKAEQLAMNVNVSAEARAYPNKVPAGDHGAMLNPAFLTAGEARLLDCMSDRAAICDRRYRYLFTNNANARFYGLAPVDFVGRTAKSIVGRKIFENLTIPTFERCFAGETVPVTVAYRARGKSMTFSARCEPIRNDQGEVVAAMMISRDVSNLSVKPESVWIRPRPTLRSKSSHSE